MIGPSWPDAMPTMPVGTGLGLHPRGPNHEARGRTVDRILSAVVNNPGVSKTWLCEQLLLGWGTMSYAVQRLEALGAIIAWPSFGCVRLFAADFSTSEIHVRCVLMEPSAREILSAVQAQGAATEQEIVASGRISPATVSRWLPILQAARLLMHDGGKPRRFICSEQPAKG